MLGKKKYQKQLRCDLAKVLGGETQSHYICILL
jgi:hypothetical protein